jgi:hypothetical protein
MTTYLLSIAIFLFLGDNDSLEKELVLLSVSYSSSRVEDQIKYNSVHSTV